MLTKEKSYQPRGATDFFPHKLCSKLLERGACREYIGSLLATIWFKAPSIMALIMEIIDWCCPFEVLSNRIDRPV